MGGVYVAIVTDADKGSLHVVAVVRSFEKKRDNGRKIVIIRCLNWGITMMAVMKYQQHNWAVHWQTHGAVRGAQLQTDCTFFFQFRPSCSFILDLKYSLNFIL